ncbi:MAG: hypothetical protein KC502_23375 [Myxococcales bacterium]|nr:hypothetical protein [Myxococcales bacterium]
MRLYIPRSLMASGLAASMVLAGCGSDDGGTGGTTTSADTASTTDSGSTQADGAGAGSDAGTTDAGATDAGAPDPCDKCTDNQECVDKKCVDKKPPCGGKCAEGEICDLEKDKCVKPSCTLPEAKTFTGNKNINKVTKLTILSDKEGCDLDDDAAPNNVLGKIVGIYPAANTALGDAVKDGTLVLIMAPDAWKTDKTEFTTDLLIGDVDPSTKGCDATAADKCKYTVADSSYDQLFSGKGTCPAKVTFDPTTVDGDKIKAGGDKQKFELNLPVVGINLKLTISKAQISGTVSDKTNWKDTKKGMLCGVLSKSDLDKAIDAVPADALKDTGFDKATIKSLIGSVLAADIDTDGDKTPDAISVALGMETMAATVTGYTKK